jgi:hypothetical protein
MEAQRYRWYGEKKKRGEVNRGRAIYLCLCRGDWLPAVVAREYGELPSFFDGINAIARLGRSKISLLPQFYQ